jgi:hypothetical protein
MSADTHLLIINPSEMVLRLVTAGFTSAKTNEKLNIKVVTTSEYKPNIGTKETFKEKCSAELIDLRTENWDESIKIVSAFAYDLAGQMFLETIQGQIILNNPWPNDKRISDYYRGRPEPDDLIIETLSYNGRHVVVQGLKFVQTETSGLRVEMISDHNDTWLELMEDCFTYLDDHEVINGPAQLYVTANKITGIKMHPSNIAYSEQVKATTRHWWDILPAYVMLKEGKANSAFRKFYEWTLNTGKTAKVYKGTTMLV